uniref:Mov34/MPN/PAD-1 family protein n=1 Tax=Zea mays TaxID=4577 RepID=B6TJS7_MAIZE|nr:mov34/MPN/PAD-1 family protein [Zea mays]|eukprot:NP_001149966.1 mov34/MPN/PAD-1 family protein [Zea mays]
MSLSSVKIGEEVWLTCLSHALTTETEEVMGLLLGDIELSSKGATALIWGASPQMRCERKKDRVEVNPDLLAAASAQADKMTATIKKTTRVIGWYHSHPHITVLPSHVDVRTQAMFQLLDTGFVGLIFSCFSEDAQKVGKIQVTAFQSEGGQQHALPLAIAPVIDLDSSLSSSDNALTSHSALVEGMEQDTGDSRASKHNKAWKRSLDFYSHPDTNHSTNYQPNENTLALYNPDNTQEAPVDPYDSDMTQSLQEALHRSTMDISGAEYRGKEVPLFVLPTRYLLKLDTTMTSYCDMQRVLFEEEQSAYNQAMQQNICDGKIHPLTSIHCTSTYNSSLCKLMEYCLSPAVITLQDRLKENELRLSMLKEECKQLEADTQGMRNGSPRRLMNHGAGGSGSPMAQSRHPFSSQGSPRSPSGGSRRRA